jgi:hypothetical protein
MKKGALPIMKLTKGLLLISISLLVFLAGCGSGTPAQQPTILQVTRTDNRSQSPTAPQSWTITDAHAVQQLYNEMQNLPEHQNNGADSCARPQYSYHLVFLAGTKSLQQDDLDTYCSTLTFADGSHRDPTTTFDSLLAGMLHISTQDL